MDIILLSVHDITFKLRQQAQRIPYPITSDTGLDLLTPESQLSITLQAHIQQRDPPRSVHKTPLLASSFTFLVPLPLILRPSVFI